MKPALEHKIYEVVGFRPVAEYALEVFFNDGVSQKIDFDGVLEGELYGPLKEKALFDRVRVDHERRNLVWPNGADFDPEILHDWPETKTAMLEAAVRWRTHGSSLRAPASLHVVWSIILGFLAGAIANFIMHTRMGFIETTLLGIVGSIVGGLIARLFSMKPDGGPLHERVYFVGASVLGAILVLLVSTIFAGSVS